MSSDEKPEVEYDELIASSDVHDVAQFTRGGETRFYRLRVVAGGADLWRTTEVPGEPPESIKETHFTNSDETAAFLRDMERALKAGGWTAV